MKKVGYVFDLLMGKHRADDDHVECPERIYSINQAFQSEELLGLLSHVASQRATKNALLLAHSEDYLDQVFSRIERFNTNGDMFANSSSLDAALLATGSTLKMVQMILDGELDSGFANVRPPGHHATGSECMGFCFFNTVAISAIMAAKQGRRVLIVDWDIHHGNGTEDILKAMSQSPDPKVREVADRIFFFSIHRWDSGHFYPQTGTPQVTSRFINVGFNGAKGDLFYVDTFSKVLMPPAVEFKPDLILVSAGFDAAIGDPLGGCYVTPEGYTRMTKILLKICPKVAIVLEGGYNLDSISRSALACVRVLLD